MVAVAFLSNRLLLQKSILGNGRFHLKAARDTTVRHTIYQTAPPRNMWNSVFGFQCCDVGYELALTMSGQLASFSASRPSDEGIPPS